MDRNCSNCTHKPICRLWYSEVESRYGKGRGIPLADLDSLDKHLAMDCKFWRKDG